MTAYVNQFDKMTSDEQFAIISALGTKKSDDYLLEEVMAGADEGTYTIQMIVNGVEVHAQDFIHRYINAIKELADSKARALVEEKFSELTEAFQPIRDVLDSAERQLAERLGVEKDSWGDY